MPIVPWIIVFPQPSVSGVCTADALLHYVHYHFGATSAGRAAAFPSPDAPLSELTLWAPGNAHCQHTLSSLTSTKAAGVIFGFWSLRVTSLTHSSNCHTKVSWGYLHSLCSNKTHVPFISPFVKTCRYFYQTHSFMSFIEENKVSCKASQGQHLCLFAYFRHYC